MNIANMFTHLNLRRHTAHNGDGPTNNTSSTCISEWPCELHRDLPVCLLHHLFICVHYTVPEYPSLAVAVWSAGSLPRMDCANNFSPKVAPPWNLRYCVFENHGVISESVIPGCAASDCICSAILHAVLWTWKSGQLTTWTIIFFTIQ